jgi:hypothetical protein
VGVFSGQTTLVYSYILCHSEHLPCWLEPQRTCSYHLTAISILCDTLFFVIIPFSLPNASFSLDLNKVMFVCYSAVIPELNSLICSLK